MKYISNNDLNIDDVINSKTCFIGIFSDSCIHCKNMKPEWNKFKKHVKKINCNSYLIELKAENINKINNKTLNEYMSYNGIPSVLKIKNGKIIKEYKGNRTANSLLQFVNKKKTFKNKKKVKKSRKLANYF